MATAPPLLALSVGYRRWRGCEGLGSAISNSRRRGPVAQFLDRLAARGAVGLAGRQGELLVCGDAEPELQL